MENNTPQVPQYHVTRDGKVRFTGTHDECFEWILHHQPQSVSWAMKYEGYKIVPVESPKPDEQ